MNMDGQIRVFTDVRHKELYGNLKAQNVVMDFHELFFVCAALGFRRGLRQPLKRRDERFWSRTITPQEWACYYAMVLQLNDNNLASIADDRRVIGMIEEFANAGMAVLIDEFLGDFLVKRGDDREPQLAVATSKELPKEFLAYVFEQAEAQGV